jgi:C4-type Zn-finger protein
MPRKRKMVGKEQRDCPACGQRATFLLYESWAQTPPPWWSRKEPVREDLHHSALCGECGFRLRSGSPFEQ